jgi:queuine/archaeosine tRNA-ribosyltransferase
MKPTPPPPRLLPLLSGTAAGSLDPVDLVEIGISAAAVDIVELALGMGLEAVDRLGGLAALTGWDGPLVAVGRTAASAPAATGWRARSLPWLVSDRDGVWELRSSLDGGTTRLALTELSDRARRLGAEPAASLSAFGVEVHEWVSGVPPPRALLVSGLAQDEARSGRFWTGSEWADLGLAASETTKGPLVAGCGCRACSIASRGYLAHLLAMREITAEHLLGWHNLHQLRLRVEGLS